MTTYAELKAQAEKLFQEAEAMRKLELASVVAEIKAKMKEFNLTVADLGGVAASGAKKVGKSKSKSDAPAKYRGPNGELWAGGLGRKPQWVNAVLAEGKSLEDFLI